MMSQQPGQTLRTGRRRRPAQPPGFASPSSSSFSAPVSRRPSAGIRLHGPAHLPRARYARSVDGRWMPSLPPPPSSRVRPGRESAQGVCDRREKQERDTCHPIAQSQSSPARLRPQSSIMARESLTPGHTHPGTQPKRVRPALPPAAALQKSQAQVFAVPPCPVRALLPCHVLPQPSLPKSRKRHTDDRCAFDGFKFLLLLRWEMNGRQVSAVSLFLLASLVLNQKGEWVICCRDSSAPLPIGG